MTPIFLLILVLTCAAEPAADLQQTSNRLASSILLGPSMDTLQELTDGIGGRVTGTSSYARAAEWAAAKFRSYGITNVRLEPFTIPAGWQRGTAAGELIAPVARPLHVESIAWAPSTPAGGMQAPVVLISDVHPDKLKAEAADIKGKIVLLDSAKIFADGYRKAGPLLHASYPLFRDAGALAVLYPDRDASNVLNAHSTGWHADIAPLPLIELGMEDAKLMERFLSESKATVTVKLEAQNKISGPAQVNNVIAEIPGNEHPEQWILIGAHLDSWDFGTGAQDNGTGSASVLEVARAFAKLGITPRRSIRFALWGGEEEGILGSYAYTQAHAQELNNCIAVLNTDNGAGHPKGWKVEGRADLREAMRPISDTILKPLSADDLSMDVSYDTDHGPFMLQGIPALDLEVDMSHYGEIHHKSSDTLDKVDPLNFKAGAAVVAVTAYAIAQDAKPIAAHIDHMAVAEIVKNSGLEPMLVEAGVWKP
jgi:hypothetical protein